MKKLPKKYSKMISQINREEDGYMIYTQKGYCINDLGLHGPYGQDTWKEVLGCLWMVMPCNCADCGYPIEPNNTTVYVGEVSK